ncbi:CheA signal transduction histidine kinase [Granulicella tundricola MP5ACTX9]|uniref:histidine kinase n=2 Tax=Granulicella TaxID=940557 RepID=E8X302_GRATM|nr:CheA signal transduction histidine kinase [Granulicella tundricola MP5ACTX9]
MGGVDTGDMDELLSAGEELIGEFLAESREGLDRMELCLTELEVRPGDGELVGEIFRAVHNIKGTVGFLGFGRLERLAHAGETLLGSLRDGRVRADEELISGLLRLLDGLREILGLIEATGAEGADGDLVLIAELTALNESGAAAEGVGARRGVEVFGAAEKTLRVDVEVLDRMMNLVGELVLTRNQIVQRPCEGEGFGVLARRLDSVTAELRESVMRARMQPVGHVFGKFSRLVRELGRTCGKKVRIEFAGLETGLDKSLLEAIKDPLTHAVRNAVDHGIEGPAERVAAGKAAEGVIRLEAYQEGGAVVIELSDDGAGMCRRRLIGKALERGLISEEQVAGMGDEDALQLIFLPGFSTAAEVTTVSGRGVGMDVVRANVEKAGGTVEVESREGWGTVLRMRVPLTLAIVPALVVRSGGQSLCLPQSAVMELVYVSSMQAARGIERMGGAQLYRLRDELLPLVWLDEVMRVPQQRQAHGFYVAVLETDGRRYGLAVDELTTPEEIVVKPLSAVLRDVGLFSGATVLGNGMLAMILDVGAVAVRAGVKGMGKVTLAAVAEAMPMAEFLVFEQVVQGRMERGAMPLGLVERIERIRVAEVEYIGGRAVMQYRGDLMGLEDEGGLRDGEMATVLVCRRPDGSGRRYGLVVARVLDVTRGEPVPGGEPGLVLVKGRLASVHEDKAGLVPDGLLEMRGLREFGRNVA